MRKRQVVVGWIDSPTGRAALGWAAHQASITGSELTAVHVLEWPVGMSSLALSRPPDSWRLTAKQVDPAYRCHVAALLQQVTASASWRLEFDQGDVADVLVREAENADLLVVGTRERAAAGRLQAGIIGHYCAGHASCPVVTVPVEFLTGERPASSPGKSETPAARRR